MSRYYKAYKIIPLFLAIFFCFCTIPRANALNTDAITRDIRQWKILGDSGWPANSSGSVTKISNSTVRFAYDLKKTENWPWPEIDFFVDFDSSQDVTQYKGVQLDIEGRKNEEIYLVFLVEDKNLKIAKPSLRRLIITNKFKRAYLPFSDFKIASDWAARHSGFNGDIEWDKVKRFGIHKKGRNGEKGDIYLRKVTFLKKSPKEIFDLERKRSLTPKYSLVNLKDNNGDIDAEITVYNNPSQQQSRIISPYLYGANLGTWLSLPDVKKAASLNLRLLRFGGPFVDRYNWRNNKYTFMSNNNILSMVALDDFIQYCRKIGAEPLIQINALGYAPDEKNEGKFTRCMDAQDAADLVRYLNQEKKYNIKFFEIGNEPFIWHQVHSDVRDSPCSIEEYFKVFKEYAAAMKAAQAKIGSAADIKIFAPGISTSYLDWATLAADDKKAQVLPVFLKKCREYENDKTENPQGFRILDALSFHVFPSFIDPKNQKITRDTRAILQSTQNWWNPGYINKHDFSLPRDSAPNVICKLKGWIEQAYPGTELAVTEFNIESESMVDYDPVIKVLYLSDLYGIMAKYRLDYAAQFCLNSSDQNIALIDDTDNITALYYPLALYAKYFKGLVLDASTSIPERLNAYASSDNGDIILMVVNKEEKKHLSRVTIKGDGARQGQQLTFAYNFPALSLTCIRIAADKNNNLAECWEYGKEQINRHIDNNPYL